jgi:hypothetical protein
MFASALLYLGAAIAVAGAIFSIKPMPRLGVRTRSRASIVLVSGIGVMAVALALPARESRIARVETRLDQFAPIWQFNEVHTIHIDAPPARVFDAIKRVRADEIGFFNLLTWIRRGGQPLPEGILNAGSQKPLVDVAISTTFVRLAEDAPRELVIGTVIRAPPGAGAGGTLRTVDTFQKPLAPGFTLATMNFLVSPAGSGSLVSTETRVFANSPPVRRRFATYWRIIYPGSAIIRRMWLRAIERRATSASHD